MRVVGGLLVTAWLAGAPLWFLLLLASVLLGLAVLNLKAEQIEAFNRMIRGRPIDGEPRPKVPPPAELESPEPKARPNRVEGQKPPGLRRQPKKGKGKPEPDCPK